MGRRHRVLAVLVVAAGAAACSGSGAPSLEEMEAICDRASDRATRSVETVRACLEVGGTAACAADEDTGRDSICDAAFEGFDPRDVNPPDAVREELEKQAEIMEECYGDGTQSVEEFEACAESLDD